MTEKKATGGGGSGGRGESFRKRLKERFEKQEEERKSSLRRVRLQLAREGMMHYQNGRFGEAVKSFHTYLRILEDWKGVPDGSLNPALFDLKKDVAEILLISGVYWDLAKLYDRTKSDQRKKEFEHYMEKYLLFSKGMPFQAVCAETLRKYIETDKPVHRAPFKHAYQVLGGKQCYVATALVDVCQPETLSRLRSFRDERLIGTFAGRALIRAYYAAGPRLASLTDRLPWRLRRRLGVWLDRLAEWLTSRRG